MVAPLNRRDVACREGRPRSPPMEGAASEDLRRALYTRLYLLGEEGPKEEEALLLELFRLAQVYGGGTGFVIGKKGVAFTEVPSPDLPPGLLEALAQGRAYQGVWRGVLYVALPREEGGFGMAVPLEGVAGLGRRLLLLYATWGGGVLLAIFLLSALGLAWALRPLGQLANLLEARRPEDLSPLPDPGLAELRPLVEALNSRLAQVGGFLGSFPRRRRRPAGLPAMPPTSSAIPWLP